MLKKIFIATIMVVGVISGTTLVPEKYNISCVSKAEAYYNIPKYFNGDKNWPCNWPGGNYCAWYIDMSSRVYKDGTWYVIEIQVENETNKIVKSSTLEMTKVGDNIKCGQLWPIDSYTRFTNAWNIVSGNSDY